VAGRPQGPTKLARGQPVTDRSDNPDPGAVEALEAAVLRRLLAHLDAHKDVQNIDLMNLAGFCRNCLAKWYAEAAGERGLPVDLDAARERVYGMPYAEWKRRYQREIASGGTPGPGAEPSAAWKDGSKS
jgi:hypothetical protein